MPAAARRRGPRKKKNRQLAVVRVGVSPTTASYSVRRPPIYLSVVGPTTVSWRQYYHFFVGGLHAHFNSTVGHLVVVTHLFFLPTAAAGILCGFTTPLLVHVS